MDYELIGTSTHLPKLEPLSKRSHMFYVPGLLQSSGIQKHAQFQTLASLPVAPVSDTCHRTGSADVHPRCLFLQYALQQSQRKHPAAATTQLPHPRACYPHDLE